MIPKPKKKRKKKKRLSPELAEQVLERDSHQCIMCGKWEVQLHHCIYRSNGGEHKLNNLVCLCLEHHNLVHSNKRKYQPIMLQYLKQFDKQ